jgi:hypothetical protein
MVALATTDGVYAPFDPKVEPDGKICPFKEVNRSPDSFVRVSIGGAMSGAD